MLVRVRPTPSDFNEVARCMPATRTAGGGSNYDEGPARLFKPPEGLQREAAQFDVATAALDRSAS